MDHAMTPPKMTTNEQVNKAVARYRALLEKHAPDWSASVVQQVLGSPELAGDQFALFRTRVEAVSNTIVRRVLVNRISTPEQMLDALGRKLYVNRDVVATMPCGQGSEAEVHFFKPSRFVSDDELEKEYALRGLVPASPYDVAAVNQADPAFADSHPNATYWKDVSGKWCYLACGRWVGERSVDVAGRFRDWSAHMWLAGVRK